MLIAMSFSRHSYKQADFKQKEKHHCRNNSVFQYISWCARQFKSGKKVVKLTLQTSKTA